MVSLTLRMSEELHAALAAHVQARGGSLNSAVCRLLEGALRSDDFMAVARETIRQEMRAEFAARGRPAQDLGSLGQLGWNPSTQQLPHQTYAYNGYPGQNCDRHTSFQGTQANARSYVVGSHNLKD